MRKLLYTLYIREVALEVTVPYLSPEKGEAGGVRVEGQARLNFDIRYLSSVYSSRGTGGYSMIAIISCLWDGEMGGSFTISIFN